MRPGGPSASSFRSTVFLRPMLLECWLETPQTAQKVVQTSNNDQARPFDPGSVRMLSDEVDIRLAAYLPRMKLAALRLVEDIGHRSKR